MAVLVFFSPVLGLVNGEKQESDDEKQHLLGK